MEIASFIISDNGHKTGTNICVYKKNNRLLRFICKLLSEQIVLNQNIAKTINNQRNYNYKQHYQQHSQVTKTIFFNLVAGGKLRRKHTD